MPVQSAVQITEEMYVTDKVVFSKLAYVISALLSHGLISTQHGLLALYPQIISSNNGYKEEHLFCLTLLTMLLHLLSLINISVNKTDQNLPYFSPFRQDKYK